MAENHHHGVDSRVGSSTFCCCGLHRSFASVFQRSTFQVGAQAPSYGWVSVGFASSLAKPAGKQSVGQCQVPNRPFSMQAVIAVHSKRNLMFYEEGRCGRGRPDLHGAVAESEINQHALLLQTSRQASRSPVPEVSELTWLACVKPVDEILASMTRFAQTHAGGPSRLTYITNHWDRRLVDPGFNVTVPTESFVIRHSVRSVSQPSQSSPSESWQSSPFRCRRGKYQ